MLYSSLVVTSAGALIPYASVSLNCGSAPVAYVGNPQRLSHAAELASPMPGFCTAIPDNPAVWPANIIDEFPSLKVAVSGGGTISNIDNPTAVFVEFDFTVTTGATTGLFEISAQKQEAPFEFCVFSPALVRTTVDCGESLREAGDVLQCVVKHMDTNGSPMHTDKALAKPNVDVDGVEIEWSTWVKAFPQLYTEFEFELPMTKAGVYTVSLNGVVVKMNAVTPPDITTQVRCTKYFIDSVGTADQVSCEIAPRSLDQTILALPDTVYPFAPGLAVSTSGDWTQAANYFAFVLTANGKSGVFTVTIGNALAVFDIAVLSEPSNYTSTCVCDAGEIFVGSSVLCTSTPRDALGRPVEFNIDRYKPVSTSDRGGVASGFSAGYVYPITPRGAGVTIGKEFIFRFMAEDRGFEERAVEPLFKSQAEANSECTRNDAAHLCTLDELQYILDHRYITENTGWGFASDDATKLYRINLVFKLISTKDVTSQDTASALCCSSSGSLTGKSIEIQDGVIKKNFPILKVSSVGDVNVTVTADSTLTCTTPVHKGQTSKCVFSAKTTGGVAVGILADRVTVNNRPLAGEEGNIRQTFFFDVVPTVVGIASVDVDVQNPETGKIQSKTFEVTVEESLAPTMEPTKSPTPAPTAEPTLEPTSHPTAFPTTSPTSPTSQMPTKEGQTFVPTPGFRPPTLAPTAPNTQPKSVEVRATVLFAAALDSATEQHITNAFCAAVAAKTGISPSKLSCTSTKQSGSTYYLTAGASLTPMQADDLVRQAVTVDLAIKDAFLMNQAVLAANGGAAPTVSNQAIVIIEVVAPTDSPPPTAEPESSKSLVLILIIVVVLGLLLLGGVGFYFYRKNRSTAFQPFQDEGVANEYQPPI